MPGPIAGGATFTLPTLTLGLTAGSSGFLADSYVRDQGTVDGIVNYESILLSLNAGGKLQEPLVLVYPKEGIITADYPFMLLNAAKKDAYDKVVTYLRSPDVQKRIMTDTLRRPAVPGVPLAQEIPALIELDLDAFKANLIVIRKLVLLVKMSLLMNETFDLLED